MIGQALQRRATRLHYTHRPITTTTRRLQSTRRWKPLRLLFCGSDDFSCASLRAVHQEQLRNPESIASIDVLVRPGKLSGRGLRSIREVPIKSVAQELGLPIHERDTFTGWTLPQPNGGSINLIIAVSFGLFVPPRILKSAEYGGINVHPSMLPDFRGPAPLHHTLLAGETHIGVTLQTLHPSKFDHGTILAQTPPPGLEIPNASQCTYRELLEFITPEAAGMLIQGIRDRVFAPQVADTERKHHTLPAKDIAYSPPVQSPRPLRHAPKITTEDRRIDWENMAAEEILRRDRVLGRLWSFFQPLGEQKKRIIFRGVKAIQPPQELQDWLASTKQDCGKVLFLPLVSHGDRQIMVPYTISGEAIAVLASDGTAVLIEEITIEGSKKATAVRALCPGISSYQGPRTFDPSDII